MVKRFLPYRISGFLKRNSRFLAELAFVFILLALIRLTYNFALTKVFVTPEITTTIPADKDVDVPLDSTIFIAFSTPMNRTLTSRSIRVNGEQVGDKVIWSGNTVTITPNKVFKRDEVITVEVKHAVSRFGVPMKTLSYSFSALANPNISMVTPVGNTPEDVKDIVVIFSKGIKTTQQNILSVTPSVEGSYKWIGNTAFVFEPKSLTVGQKYSVKLNQDLQATDGGKLAKGYSFDFVNMSPELFSLKIDEETSGPVSQFNPAGTLYTCFNQQVDLNSAREHMYFYDTALQTVKVPVQITGFFEKQSEEKYWSEYCDGPVDEGRYVLRITPASQLKPSSSYIFKVEGGILSLNKSAATTLTRDMPLTTAAIPKFLGFSIRSGAKDVDYEDEIVMHFASPMASSVLAESISVNGKKGFYEYISFSNTDAYLSKVLEPSTTYTITLPNGIKDKFGRSLPNGGSVTFTTKATAPYLSISIYPRNQKFTNYAAHLDKRVIVRTTNIPKLEYNLYEINSQQYALTSSTQYNAYSKEHFGPDDLTVSELNRLGVKKVGSWSKVFDISPNTTTDTIFNFNKDAKFNIKPGYYVLNVKDAMSNNYQDSMLLFVGDTALTAKLSYNGVLLWAASTSKQDVKPNLNVEMYKILAQPKSASDVFKQTSSTTSFVKKIVSGKTDSQGIAQLKDDFAFKNIEPNDYYVVASGGGDIGFVRGDWSEGISQYDFANVNYNYDTAEQGPKSYKVFAFTDRTLYRPGQKLSYRTIIRENKLHTYSIAKPIPIKVTITGYDASWSATIMYEKVFADGSVDKFEDFVIPESAITGTYALTVSSPTGLFDDFSADFSVQYYQRPDFEVQSVVPDLSFRNAPETIKVRAKYFYGSPVAGAQANYTVFKRDFIFNAKTKSDFKFYSDKKYFGDDYAYEGFEESEVANGNGLTSNLGDMAFSFTPNNTEGVSNIYTVETEVLGPSGRKFSGNNEFVAHMAEVYLGIKNQNYSIEQGKSAKFSLITLDPSEKQVGGSSIKVDLYRRKYFRVKKQDTEGYFYYETSYEDILEDTKNVKSSTSGEVVVDFKPENGGLYLIEASTRDSRGNVALTDTRLYVSSSSDSGYWQQENHDRVEVITDKSEYRIGDIAKVLTTANIEKGMGLLTVEAEGVVYYKVFKQSASGNSIDLPITDKFVPNVYLSTTIIGQGTSVFDPPEFKMGIANIKIDSSSKKLAVAIASNKQSYSPKEKGTLDIYVKDAKGASLANSEVTIALVDDALLTISPIKRANIFDYFYAARYLSIRTFQSLITSLDRINANTEVGAKGGSGSKGGAGGAYIDLTRSNFAETALWLPKVKTDASGRALVPFTLPDSTTRWNVFVVAQNSAGDKFGQNVAYFTTKKEYFIDTAFPRFLRINDTFDLAGVIHNTTKTAKTLEVNVSTTGLSVANPRSTIQVEASSSKRIGFKAVAASIDEAKVTLTLKENGKIVDIIEKSMPIYPFGVEQVQSFSNTASYEGTNNVTISPTLNRTYSSLKVRAYSSLLGVSKELAQNLLGYDYDCNEQISSKILPQIYLNRFNKEQGEKQNLYLESNIKDGINRLIKTQQSNGGWGFWQNTSADTQNTARVLEVLYEANRDGFAVKDEVLKKGKDFLSSGTGDSDPYTIYVLQLVGYDATSQIADAYNSYLSMSDYDKAYLILAMLESPHNWSNHINVLKSSLLLHADYGSGRVFWTKPNHHWFIGDATTPTSAVLRVLNRIDRRSPVADLAIISLLQNSFKTNREINTYAMRTSSVAILENYIFNGTKLRDTDIEVVINGLKAGSGKLTKYSLTPYEVNRTLSSSMFRVGENEVKTKFIQGGRNFYSILLTSFEPFETIEIASNELGLDRRYYTTDGKEVSDGKFKAGESYFVKLTIAVPNIRRNVVIEDYLPAGTEAVNGSLTNEASTKYYKSDINLGEQKDTSQLYYSHANHMDDRTALFIDNISKGVYEYTYAIRATTPGEYRLRPAQAYEMYSPDIRANTKGGVITVLE